MGTHYKVFIFDDHFGLSSKTEIQEAESINKKLTEKKANVFENFKYIPLADCIVGELRKDHPINHIDIFNYDNVYYQDDSSGSHLINLKKGKLL